MARIRWLVVVVGLGVAAPEAPAQGVIAPAPYPFGYGPVYGGGIGISYARGRPGRGLSIWAGAYPGDYYLGPPPFYRRPRINVYIVTPPPVVVVPGPPLIAPGLPYDILPRRRDFDPGPSEEDGPRPGIRRIAPPGKKEKEEPQPPPPPVPPPPEPPEPEEKPFPWPPPPPADEAPAEAYRRQLALGREAFFAMEYGRAVRHFRQAGAALPKEALPHFLLAQTFFALGKYHDAADAIHAGLALNPDWPRGRFRARDLYGADDADFLAHLKTLQGALARHPNDPVLLFLTAYQLWFDGRKDEARTLFRRALPRFAHPEDVRRFLRDGGAGVVI